MDSEKLLHVFFADTLDIGNLWDGQYKIPWDEPGFSRRMLKEHLSQEHDLASRKSGMIEAQVGWIHERLCDSKPRKMLDMGCGPGFYIKEFAARGYECTGIDFSPASIEYAIKTIGDKATMIQGDIRTTAFGSGYDLAMMVYGEFNVFSPTECQALVQKAYNALNPGGVLLIEGQSYDAVKGIGEAPNSWFKAEISGLFSPHPHVCLVENQWFDEQSTSVQKFIVIEAKDGNVSSYRNTSRAWSETGQMELLSDAGFIHITKKTEWPVNSDALFLVLARKPD